MNGLLFEFQVLRTSTAFLVGESEVVVVVVEDVIGVDVVIDVSCERFQKGFGCIFSIKLFRLR